MVKRKEYLAVVKLSFDYDDSMLDEWEDNGDKELKCLDSDSIRWDMINNLEDLGLVVEHIEVVEDRAWGGVA
jgi:hypothetical protein